MHSHHLLSPDSQCSLLSTQTNIHTQAGILEQLKDVNQRLAVTRIQAARQGEEMELVKEGAAECKVGSSDSHVTLCDAKLNPFVYSQPEKGEF